MSAVVRINLLPHRAQKRVARQRQFISLGVSLAILGLAVVGLVHGFLATRIDNQKSRNTLLKTEIAKLDDQIKEIDKLRDQIQQVLARKQVVETLQTTRSEAVHMLDQLVRQLPDGVYLKSVKQSGQKVTMIGYAQSNARVSTLMRNIESSPWIDKPELVEIKLVTQPGALVAKGSEPPKINEFTLNFQVKRAAPPPLDVRAAGAGRAAAAGGGAAPAPGSPAPTPPKGGTV